MAGKKSNQSLSGKRASSQKRDVPARKRTKGGTHLPILPVVVGGLLVAGAVVLGVIAWQSARTGSVPSGTLPVNGITCDGHEQVSVHYHVHLDLLISSGNAKLTVPAGIGINQTQQCLYWLHTHQTDGVIHIEAPTGQKDRVFTLGEFFKIWGQKLDSQDVGDRKLQSGETLKAYVNGVLWTGNVSAIPLKAHDEITLVIGPPDITPPSSYSFAAGL